MKRLVSAEKTDVKPPACGGCTYYGAPKIQPAGATFVLSGRCRRFPVEALKSADDWCGEFKNVA